MDFSLRFKHPLFNVNKRIIIMMVKLLNRFKIKVVKYKYQDLMIRLCS